MCTCLVLLSLEWQAVDTTLSGKCLTLKFGYKKSIRKGEESDLQKERICT